MRCGVGLLARLPGGLVTLLVTVALAAWSLARPTVPDAIYTAPAAVSAEPGTRLHQKPFERAAPAGARAWRMLYTTTDARGAPALSGAIVMASRSTPQGPRPVLAWTHGRTGAVPGCAPSLLADPFANVPALAPLVERGWIFVATDYAGQATPGPHPYLIGDGEARSALDAVRAARRMPDLQVGPQTVVWGHSQGGHAALWTGILAPSYAPDVAIAGMAAAAPAGDLRPLIDVVKHTLVGRIMTSYVMRAYDDTYPDVRWDDYVGGWFARHAAADMARRCLAGGQALFTVAVASALRGAIFSADPRDGALGERLALNTPDRPIMAPLMVAQGEADDLVRPTVQARWVARRCAAGQRIDYRPYAGQDHLSLVSSDAPFSADLVRWTEDRLAGCPAATTCPT